MIRHFGITALGEAPAVKDVIASGRIDAAQVYYNMLNPSAGETMPPAWTGHNLDNLIAACRAHEVGVMNIRAFAAGVIATDQRTGPRSDHHRRNPNLGRRTQSARGAGRFGPRTRHAGANRDSVLAEQSGHRLRRGRHGRISPSRGSDHRRGNGSAATRPPSTNCARSTPRISAAFNRTVRRRARRVFGINSHSD